MSENKWTPGPWTIVPRARSGHVDGIAHKGRTFVQVGSDEADDERQDANARLISLAPELAEAVEAAESFIADDSMSPSRREAVLGNLQFLLSRLSVKGGA